MRVTSLIFGAICIYFAVTILRLPEEKFRKELDDITGRREHAPRFYGMMRTLIKAVGVLGGAIIVLRFF